MSRVTARRMFRSLAVLATSVLAAETLGAQALPRQFTVTTRLGALTAERAASLQTAALIGLDTEYSFTRYAGVGVSFDVSRGNTTREDFVTRLRYGNAAVAGGDSIYYQYVGQPINTINLGLYGTLRYPGRIMPFIMGGVGSYSMIADAQVNGKASRLTDVSLTGGAGVAFRLGERVGVQLDARAVQYQGFDREFLNPARGRAEQNVPFPEDFQRPPAAKNTAFNTMFTLGFRYIPGGVGGGN